MNIMVDGKMCGPDIGKTRAPQATGITTLAAFCKAAAIEPVTSVPKSLASPNFKVVFLRHGESVWNVANIFTGWADVDLSPAGELEAIEAGKCLKQNGFKFDVVFTSVLRRSIKTAWTALMHSDNYSMPIINSWRLNERHYGALQGLNKAETAAEHGDDQVKIWRRSYDIPPPSIDLDDERHPCNDPLYKNVPSAALPGVESLALTVERVLPFWFDNIAPCIMAGRSVLVAAHGNSLRAICKYLEKMSEAGVLELNIPTSVPLVYELDYRLNFVKKYYLMDPDEVAKKVAAVANQGKVAKDPQVMIFQLGTNNWQSVEEPAPGSGILHEAHHIAYNAMPGCHSYSVYPSSIHSENPGREKVKVAKLPHKIPICESISPVSDKRWHGMPDSEVAEYMKRLEDLCYDQMALGEAETGRTYDFAIAHHCFLNQVVMQRVIRKRMAEGKAKIPLVAFCHGTALKMFNLEKKGDPEYPMRFKSMMEELKVFEDVQAVVTISEDNKNMFLSHFPSFKEENIFVSLNGYNPLIFYKYPDTLQEGLKQFTTKPYEGSGRAKETIPGDNYQKMVLFVGKFADWKRLDMVLKTAKLYEAKYPDICTVIAGTGGPNDIKYYQDMAYEEVGLEHTYFVGAQMQPDLARLASIANIGVFPSKSEPFGMVFIECMACGTPVIGANSGGPRDFVSEAVGCLIPDDELSVPSTDKLINDLFTAVCTALDEDWKTTKGPACLKLTEKFSMNEQCDGIVRKLSDILKL